MGKKTTLVTCTYVHLPATRFHWWRHWFHHQSEHFGFFLPPESMTCLQATCLFTQPANTPHPHEQHHVWKDVHRCVHLSQKSHWMLKPRVLLMESGRLVSLLLPKAQWFKAMEELLTWRNKHCDPVSYSALPPAVGHILRPTSLGVGWLLTHRGSCGAGAPRWDFNPGLGREEAPLPTAPPVAS